MKNIDLSGVYFKNEGPLKGQILIAVGNTFPYLETETFKYYVIVSNVSRFWLTEKALKSRLKEYELKYKLC